MNTGKFLVGMVLALLLSLSAFGQGSAPDCKVDFVLTGASTATVLDNRGTFCDSWTVAYYSVGFTSTLSLLVQAAPATTTGVPGSWATFGGTVLAGANPLTSVVGGTLKLDGFYPFLRINLSSLTGSGTVRGRLYGWRSAAPKVCITPVV